MSHCRCTYFIFWAYLLSVVGDNNPHLRRNFAAQITRGVRRTVRSKAAEAMPDVGALVRCECEVGMEEGLRLETGLKLSCCELFFLKKSWRALQKESCSFSGVTCFLDSFLLGGSLRFQKKKVTDPNFFFWTRRIFQAWSSRVVNLDQVNQVIHNSVFRTFSLGLFWQRKHEAPGGCAGGYHVDAYDCDFKIVVTYY